MIYFQKKVKVFMTQKFTVKIFQLVRLKSHLINIFLLTALNTGCIIFADLTTSLQDKTNSILGMVKTGLIIELRKKSIRPIFTIHLFNPSSV
jgi:hypothetical protein